MESVKSSVDFWDEFLRKYYWNDILKLADDYPESRSLIVQFPTLNRCNYEVANELLDNPDTVLKHALDAISSIDLPVDDVDLAKANIRISDCREKIRRRDLRQEHVGKLIALDGIVQRATDVIPKTTVAAFLCQRCNEITLVHQENNRFVEPFTCGNDLCGRKTALKFKSDASEKIDFQTIRLQELTEDLRSGEKSQTIDVYISDDIAGSVLPGNKVTIIGILRAYQRIKSNNKTPFLDLCIDANHIQINEGHKSIILSKEDKQRMREMASEKDIINKIISSFAPTIHGLEMEKEGILCSAVSNGYKIRPDGTPQREYSHTLICSDPGMAKTNIKLALKAIMPNLVMSSGTGSTKAGLTAAVVKDDFAGGAWSIEAGAMVLADGGGIALDEFDKFKSEVRNLNDALSNCQFEINKAGFNLKLWTRCFVVAFQNPKYGRFDRYLPLTDQIDIAPDTLSRFDLIFLLRDDVNDQKDLMIGNKIFDAWVGIEEEHKDIIPLECMQKYIAYAQTIQPEIPEELRDEIVKKYLTARRRSTGETVAVTARYAEALLRLSKAEAQLALSNVVTIDHIKRASKLIDASLNQTTVDDKGRLDSDIINVGMGRSQRDRIKLFLNIIKKISDESGGLAPVGEVVLECETAGFDKKQIETMIEKLKNTGDICELKGKKLKVA